ncbi:MAG: LPS export ABC transporter periplasmic protein LptC [Spirulinaceae cyanobacterium]
MVLTAALFLAACRGGGEPVAVNEDQSETPAYEEQLILNNATLENADEDGNVLWRVEAQRTTYEPNQQDAQIEGITGNFYEDGEIVLKLKADAGEILEDGQTIYLRENVVATDPRTGVVMQCQEVEWSPEANVLIARQSLRGSNDEWVVAGEQGKYTTQTQVLEVIGDVVIDGKTTPLQARTEKAVWDVPQEQVASDRPIEIDRYKPPEDPVDNPNSETTASSPSEADQPEAEAADSFVESTTTEEVTGGQLNAKPQSPKPHRLHLKGKPEITDRVVAQSATFDLAKQVVVLKKEVESRSVEPPLQIASDSIIWNLNERTVLSDTPVQVINRADAITLTANEGLINLETEVLRLNGGARGINTRRPADLYANQIVWHLEDERLEAAGNVIYRQADPPLDLAGSRAIGRLKDQTIVVTGGEGGGRVLTKIVP